MQRGRINKMISSALLTLTITISLGSNEIVSADEIKYQTDHLICTQGRIEDRIGNSIRLAGYEDRVTVSSSVKLPRRGTRERAPLLYLNLIKLETGWQIIDAKLSNNWTDTVEKNTARLSTNRIDLRTSICQFLLRESPKESRGSLWRDLKKHWANAPQVWLQLGGQFLSSDMILAQEIERNNMQNLALEAGLYRLEEQWISKKEFQSTKQLVEVDGKVLDSNRMELRELAANELKRILSQSNKSTLPGEIQAGAARKTLRSMWGDPNQVTWIQHQNHMIEQWNYPTQSVRMIDGKVFAISSKKN